MTVELDWTAVSRGLRQLESGLDAGAKRGANEQASATATAIRRNVPVRTGALRDSVAVVPDGDGYAVTYGTGLKYAWPVEAKVGAVGTALDGADQSFATAMETVARREVGRL